MKTDRYLRIILTIIAVELLWLGIKDVAPTAQGTSEDRFLAGRSRTPDAGRVATAITVRLKPDTTQ